MIRDPDLSRRVLRIVEEMMAGISDALPFLGLLISAAAVVLLWSTLGWTRRSVIGNVIPQIECYLRPKPNSSKSVCQFVIANVGVGSAENVSYRLEYNKEDFEAHSVWMLKRETDSPFQILVGKSEIAQVFGAFVPLLKEPPLKPFQVVVEYEWKSFYKREKQHGRRIFTLDAAPFSGLAFSVENSAAEVLKKELPKVTEAIKDLTREPIDPKEIMQRMEARDAQLRRKGRA